MVEEDNATLLQWGLSFGIAIVIALNIFMVLVAKKSVHPDGGQPSTNSVVVVTAHPDDECMFFGPTLLKLLEDGFDVHLLCLSNGNYDGAGETREKELHASATILGLSPNNVHIRNNQSEFRDHPDLFWDSSTICNVVGEFIKNNSISTVITFDERGVSGHPNHISVFQGVNNCSFIDGQSVRGFVLESTSMLRKYLSFFDVPLAGLSSRVAVNNFQQAAIVKQAMAEHHTQSTWFRKLYMHFSRYIFVNTLRPIKKA